MTTVRDNPDKGRFELELGGQVVFARYARHGSVLVIPHVEAPPALRDTGAARGDGDCPDRGTEGQSVWMRRHREYHDLLG
jgi:hypothetical protein